jgi:hypothetical protein
MSVHRLLGPVFLALAVAIPQVAAAQTAPATLAAQTKGYFTAVLHADGPVLSRTTTNTFHLIELDGTRLDYQAFMRSITNDAFNEQEPMGVDVNIKSSNVTDSQVTETVDTLLWFYGAISIDPMSAPVESRDYATHTLTWTKAADGTWLLDEDHVTSSRMS